MTPLRAKISYNWEKEIRTVRILPLRNNKPQAQISDMPAAPHTILVHGFTRSRYDMVLMARRLKQMLPETTVHIFGYRSRALSISQAAALLADFVATKSKGEPVSFIGHSLGGLIIRALDTLENPPAPLHRLVTLGTPHQGSSAARFLSKSRLLTSIGGPVFKELAAPALSPTPRHVEVGCIIGATNTMIGFLPLLKGDNDGLVCVNEAIFPAAKAEIRAPIFHGFFPFSKTATILASQFLVNGSFN